MREYIENTYTWRISLPVIHQWRGHFAFIVRWKKKGAFRSLLADSVRKIRGRPFSGGSDPSKPSESSLNTAAISREGHQTARGPPTKLWFPYAPITDPSTGHVLSRGFLSTLLLPESPAPRPRFGSPSLANNLCGAFLWPLIDVDLFIGLLRTRGKTLGALCVRLLCVDSGEIWWTIS